MSDSTSMDALTRSWPESEPGAPLIVNVQFEEGREVLLTKADIREGRHFEKVMNLLKAEVAPLDVWLHFAVAYYNVGQKDLFRELLMQVYLAGDDIEQYYEADRPRFKIGRLRILNALGGDAMKQAQAAPAVLVKEGDQTKEDLNDTALRFFKDADQIDPMSALTWVGKGIFQLSKADYGKAKYYFHALRHGKSIPGLLGEASIAFFEGHYQEAMDMYADAIRINPGCSASVRVGFGLCCHRLGQTERAVAAFERALQLEPNNVHANIALAVINKELAAADPAGSAEKRHKAFRHNYGAYRTSQRLGVDNAMVLNHLASNYFWEYAPPAVPYLGDERGELKFSVEAVVSSGSTSCRLIISAAANDPKRANVAAAAAVAAAAMAPGRSPGVLGIGDYVKIGASPRSLLTRVTWVSETSTDFRVVDAWPSNFPGGSVVLLRRNFEKVLDLTKRARAATESQAIRAESTFLAGRVHHALGNLVEAKDCYAEACRAAPSLAPAQFGHAQLLLREKKFDQATACLREVLKELPSCPEALVMLAVLQAASDQRRAALGSFKRALELDPRRADVWVAFAQAQQGEPADHEGALASYARALAVTAGPAGNHALSATERRATWNNVGVLNEHLGRLQQAQQAYHNALEHDGGSAAAGAVGGRSIGRAQLPPGTASLLSEPANRCFWTWRQVRGVRASVAPGSNVMSVRKVREEEESDGMLMDEEGDGGNGSSSAPSFPLAEGQHVRIGGERDGLVTVIIDDPMATTLPQGSYYIADAVPGSRAPQDAKVWRKVQRMSLENDVCTVAFNMALLHERRGQHGAAYELYKAITYYHPSHVGSYVRMGCISRDAGHINQASRWLNTAQSLEPGNKDVLSYLGNLHVGSAEWSKAQKLFEKVQEIEQQQQQRTGADKDNEKEKSDSYILLSLGNIYFSNLDDKGKFDKHLLYAANYYKQVLGQNTSNAYAANGIGMIMAEKEALEAARDVFARVREVSAESMADVWVNLAHVYSAMRKHQEAVRLYQHCLRRSPGGRDASLHLFLASVHFEMQRWDECRATLLKGLRLFPNDLQLWYNMALTRESYAVSVLQREQKGERRTLKDVKHALGDLVGAEALFTWLEDGQERNERRRLPYSTERARKHRGFCAQNVARAEEHYQHEVVKAQQEREMRDRRSIALKQEEEMRRQADEEEARRRREAEMALEERARNNDSTVRRVLDTLQSSRERERSSKEGGGGGGRRRGSGGGRRRSGGAGRSGAGGGGGAELSDEDVPSDSEVVRGGTIGGDEMAAPLVPAVPDRYGNTLTAGEGGAGAVASAADTMRDMGLASSEDSSDDEDDEFNAMDGNSGGGGGSGAADSQGAEDGDDDDTLGERSPVAHKRGRDEDGVEPPPASRPRRTVADEDEEDN